jgi:hypothetical protein
LDDLSEIREFYENCSQIDLWTVQEFCAYISHCRSRSFGFHIRDHPETGLYVERRKSPAGIVKQLGDPASWAAFSPLSKARPLREELSRFLKAAVLGGAFEITLLDRDNWEKSSLNPKKGMEWAKKKGIDYHPVLDELLLDLNVPPATSVRSLQDIPLPT